MYHPDRRRRPLPLVAAALLAALAAAAGTSRAETGDRVEELRTLEIVSPEGYRRILVSGDENEPVVVRTMLVRRARLGIGLLDITPELRRHFGASDGEFGVLVSRVVEKSPAATAGIEVGDVLVAVDSKPIAHSSQLLAEIGGREAGTTVVIEARRQGQAVTVHAELEEAPRAQVDLTPLLFRGMHAAAPGEEGLHHHPGAVDLERALEIDGRVLNEALQSIGDEIGSGRLDHHFEELRKHRGGVLERLEQLERRLRELETEIEELPPDDE